LKEEEKKEHKEEEKPTERRGKRSSQPSSRKRLLKNLGLTALLAGMTNVPSDVQSQSKTIGSFLPQNQNLENPFLPYSQNVSNPFMIRTQNWCDLNKCKGEELEIAERIAMRLSGGSTSMDRNLWNEVQRRTQEEILKMRNAKSQIERLPSWCETNNCDSRELQVAEGIENDTKNENNGDIPPDEWNKMQKKIAETITLWRTRLPENSPNRKGSHKKKFSKRKSSVSRRRNYRKSLKRKSPAPRRR
jgi:hypothetical protein